MCKLPITTISKSQNSLDFDSRISTGEKEVSKIRFYVFFRLKEGEFISFANGKNRKVQFRMPVDSTHFSEKLAPGIIGEPGGDIGLSELIADKKQSDFVRASAVKALSNYNIANVRDKVISFLNDDSALVRGAALDVLGEINNTDYTSYFLPLLHDSKRTVRIKAFYGLGSLNKNEVPEKYREDYQRVEKEFNTYLDENLDFVGGRIKRANYYLKQGNIEKGIEGYESALEIDNTNNQARFNLANLYYNNGNFDKAEAAFKTVIEQEPGFGPTYYSLALLYAEQGLNEEAIDLLNKAIKIMPENVRVYYNLSLLHDKINEQDLAEKTLINGLKIDSKNESLLYALTFHYYKYGQIDKARNMTIRLVQLFPGNPQYANFLQQLNAKG